LSNSSSHSICSAISSFPSRSSLRSRRISESQCSTYQIRSLGKNKKKGNQSPPPGATSDSWACTSAGAPRSIEHSRAETVPWRSRDHTWAGPSAARRPSLAIATRAEGRSLSALVRQRVSLPRSPARVPRSLRLVRFLPDKLVSLSARARDFYTAAVHIGVKSVSFSVLDLSAIGLVSVK
jgi:hypothetical protein